MKKPLIMTPGPTEIHEDVRKAMAQDITNPDLDIDFFEFYKQTCDKLKKLLNTKNDVLILNGEGILGLEAACASLIEPGDRILCIDNGIFGKGFGDFAKIYGGEVIYFEGDYRRAIDLNELKDFLEKDNDFKLATLVYCETPSGITNPVDEICPLLKEYGIISVVDAVSAIGGEPIEVDKWQMDVVLGGSQKCLSASPGLTLLSISKDAWDIILNRNIPIKSFYCNLALWKNWYEEKWFPYTQPISDIYGLDCAVDRILERGDYIERHKKIANGVRESFIQAGLELYPLSGYSNTVTTVLIPKGISFNEIFSSMLEDHNIMIAGAFDYLENKVIRIGHMGENCYEDKTYITLKALNNVFKKHGIKLNGSLHKYFVDIM
ncbi:aspartate aminotransferase-like enzyme [Keratinibaculum paraultunense]|uniref:Aspartate aminotransferase-like enzyme n=1 Tax=Keratinibaculum paraultunense TaxID=1278232 RepID=A0A4R3L253_9FIRM|nr:alanine--glyoxylate aminotransferase family protein [Keratinibaculum paraultunense]QQY78908.1 alanine--glyoxylate aminotransferase family protein [Keratinibaculum paraultunense]TCS90522.1 aspartate aminotransferase-like enzyme [Keratinibaculum paraultunense]